jgi:hypothetical protein
VSGDPVVAPPRAPVDLNDFAVRIDPLRSQLPVHFPAHPCAGPLVLDDVVCAFLQSFTVEAALVVDYHSTV